MKLRIAVAVAYAVLLGVWAWTEQHSSGAATDWLGIALIPGAVIVGIVVRRWWAFLVLLGAVIPLVGLDLSGFVKEGDDGNPPFGDIQMIRLTLWVVFPLVIGLCIGAILNAVRADRPARLNEELR